VFVSSLLLSTSSDFIDSCSTFIDSSSAFTDSSSVLLTSSIFCSTHVNSAELCSCCLSEVVLVVFLLSLEEDPPHPPLQPLTGTASHIALSSTSFAGIVQDIG
jgi:hypothetical protein